ncbi:MAG: carboxypeptidase-like regulatory domain-containing protein [Verrucomicrobiae bacterium]|nr:carboxypeptidase-like regulatory domain-containing protein [Verrucomicrobiae bacterium]
MGLVFGAALVLCASHVRGSGVQQAELPLQQGWNLISLPLQPTNTSITRVLAPIAGKFEAVWTYVDGRWQGYNPSVPGLNDLKTMVAGRAYWIRMREPAVLRVTGLPPVNAVNSYAGQQLQPGWNLLGYSARLNQDAATAFAPIAGNLEMAVAFLGTNRVWYVPGDNSGNTLGELRACQGVWVHVNAPANWVAPNYRGTVVDAVTGKPVSGAVVALDGIEGETTTDAQGSFVITGIPDAPQQVLTVTANDYEPVVVSASLASSAGGGAAAQGAVLSLAPLPQPRVCEILVPQNNSVWVQQ